MAHPAPPIHPLGGLFVSRRPLRNEAAALREEEDIRIFGGAFIPRHPLRDAYASREDGGSVQEVVDERLVKRSKEVELKADMEASDILSKTISAEDAENAEVAKEAGNALFTTSDYAAALEKYTEAIELNPTDASYRSNRSACHLKLGKNLPAIHDAAMTVKLQPDWVKGYFRLSMARLEVGRHEDAATAAWEGLCVEPENVRLVQAFQRCVRVGKRLHEEEVERKRRARGNVIPPGVPGLFRLG